MRIHYFGISCYLLTICVHIETQVPKADKSLHMNICAHANSHTYKMQKLCQCRTNSLVELEEAWKHCSQGCTS